MQSIGGPNFLPHEIWLRVLLFYLLVGAGEEVFFRGFLFALMRDVLPTVSLLVTSLTFGLLHFQDGIQNVVFAGIVGLGYGLARQAGMSLVLLVLLHWLINVPGHLPHDGYSEIVAVNAPVEPLAYAGR